MTDYLRPDDTRTWLEMLFDPEDVFEVRIKQADEYGAKQIWIPYSKAESFVSTHIPVHSQHERHIWVGIAARKRMGDTTPVKHKALWVDFDETVTEEKRVHDAIEAASLPVPTMIVCSGNGFHAYWALNDSAPPEDVAPFAKGVHAALPADTTHDSSRVMRVPGTINVKNGETRPCYIVEHRPELAYDLEDFPMVEVTRHPAEKPVEKPGMKPINPKDRDLFVTNWIDGQKHAMAVAVAGYLRRSLNYDREQARAEIQRIHETAGYEMDANLHKVVDDTYDQLWAKVAGLTKLRELGVVPSVKDNFSVHIVAPPKPKIEIIDFDDDLTEQEFWVEGLIGPGLLTLWAAEPKTGKSFAAMQIGHALATGTPLWDFETTSSPLRVLYFQGELSKGMVYQRAKQMWGPRMVRDAKRYAMTAKPPEPIDLVAQPEALMDVAEHYDVIIVDPISVFSTNDESRSHSVNEVISVFDRLRSKGKAVILVHHTRKLDTNSKGQPVNPTFNDVRGSGAWFATADALALQYRTGESANTRVKFIFRAAPDREELTLFRMPHGGFSHRKTDYLAAQGGAGASIAKALN